MMFEKYANLKYKKDKSIDFWQNNNNIFLES